MMMFKTRLSKMFACLFMAGAILAGSACHGGFVLTRKWDGFISSIGNKWLRWIIFLILGFVYGFTFLADVIVFNSIEFWSGSNPIALGQFDQNGEFKKVVVAGDERAELCYKNFGEILEVSLTKKNEPARTIMMRRDQPGVIFENRGGSWVRVDVQESAIQESYTSRQLRVLVNGKQEATVSVSESDYRAALQKYEEAL